ncbi:MAG: energy transducer TonB [Spirochaetaceae bacterium]|jgi:protein TonB|nr:energy transducer TonB [Spirochaetaceae bacterium]
MKSKPAHNIVVFIAVAAFHIIALLFIAFNVQVGPQAQSEYADVMKLVDIQEAPQTPPEPSVQQNITEAIAENMIETDTLPDIVATAPSAVPSAAEEYISQSKVSIMPKFNEKSILSKLVYPPIAQRSGITEGRVLLELFVNKQGFVTRINILKEEPSERGFGEAAVRAFTGIQATPAESNGQIVAVRIRYPVRFQLK